MLHQCVDLANFNNIVGAITAKQTWEILEKSHSGGEKVKKVRLQVLQRQYELVQKEDFETVVEFFMKVQTITNTMTGCV